jgi:hypothetical protein
MVLFPVLKWWQPDQFMVSWTVLEVAWVWPCWEALELVLGAAGRGARGPHTGRGLALVGSIVGDHGCSGTGAARGPLLGACLGAFVMHCSGPCGPAHAVPEPRRAGAAMGQFWGTVLKLAIGAIIAIMLTIAAFV